MDAVYIKNKTFEKINGTQDPLPKGDYDYCTFTACDFSNADLAGINFMECHFIGCNLSMAKVTMTAFRDIIFKDSKILGLHFDQCNKMGITVTFEGCSLNHSSFYQVRIPKTIFRNTLLHEVDFTQCDLSLCRFENCDLTGATFDNTILEKADLRTSVNYSLDPERNRIKKARFSIWGVAGLLQKYKIEIDFKS